MLHVSFISLTIEALICCSFWCSWIDVIFLVRYATTEMRKLANRMQFGVPEESSLGKAFFKF